MAKMLILLVTKAAVQCFALITFVFSFVLTAQAQTEPVRIAVIDGNSLSYERNRPQSNHEVWADLLPQLLRNQNLELEYFDIGLPDQENIWIQPSDIIDFKPSLVIIHWSSFGNARRVQFCRPFGRPSTEHCSQRLFQFMNTILAEQPSAKFLAYSRADNLCRDVIHRDVRSQINRTFDQNRFVERLGFILFTESSGRGRGFRSERAQRDINSIVRHLIGIQNYEFLPTDARDGLCILGR